MALAMMLTMVPGLAASQPVPAPQHDERGTLTDTSLLQDQRYLNEIDQLLAAEQIQLALQHIIDLEESSVQDLIELTQIPAPPFAETERGLRFAEMLREAGLEQVSIDEVGNVIGTRPGRSGQRVVAFAAHLDTVFPAGTDLTVRQQDQRYYAPGIGDNTRGLIVVLNVLRALQFANIETEADVLFIGNVGEEGLGDLRGVKHLFRPGAKTIDAFIAVDGGNAERLVYGGVGSHRYKVVFQGPGGHSWGAFGSANPHHALADAITRFDQMADPITRSGPKSSYSTGRIGGGTSINSIPFESWAEIDIRSGDQQKIDVLDALLQQAINAALAEENAQRREGPELTVSIEQVGKRPAATGDLCAPLAQRAMAAMHRLGLRTQATLSSTDANLPLSLGIPAITISRGGLSGEAHSPGEWWQAEQAHIGVQAGFLTLLAEADA